MKIIVAPDSYKGCLSAIEVCNAVESGIRCVVPDCEVVKIPMADGGEGTVEAMVFATGGRLLHKQVTGPLGESVQAFYGILGDGKTAVIEMAAASGLPLVGNNKNPLITTTYGTGELIRDAIEQGCRHIIIGIGGSATNDGGMGMAQALGVRFLNADGEMLGHGGGELSRLNMLDLSDLMPEIKQTRIQVACDVTNPLCGPEGASAIYGPQKGATPEMVQQLDSSLRHYASVIKSSMGIDIVDMPGSGAAGGLGGGLVAFAGASLESGVEIVTSAVKLSEKTEGAVLVITGEGRTDRQTAYGKVPVGVSKACAKGVPVICLSGGIGEGTQVLYEKNISAFFSITDGPMSLDEAITNADLLLRSAAENLVRFMTAL